MREYNVFNVLDLIESIGEEQVVQLLSDFSCPQNFGMESFLQNKAIQFAKQKISWSLIQK